jgi:hypothetical protein
LLLDLEQFKKEKFFAVVEEILNLPKDKLDFESVADFYQAAFLDDFPKGTIWSATGLDDGAEQFYAIIEYKDCYLKINKTDSITFESNQNHVLNNKN